MHVIIFVPKTVLKTHEQITFIRLLISARPTFKSDLQFRRVLVWQKRVPASF